MKVITDKARARHTLLVKAATLAEAIVEEHYRLRPDFPSRYGPAGRAKCVQDVAYHLQFLAASVGIGDSRHFERYIAWADSVMSAHGVPTTDLIESLQITRRVLAAALPADTAPLACLHVDGALAALRQPRPGKPREVGTEIC